MLKRKKWATSLGWIYHLSAGQVCSVGALKPYLTHHLLHASTITQSTARPHVKHTTAVSYRTFFYSPLQEDALSPRVPGKDSDLEELNSAGVTCPEGTSTHLRHAGKDWGQTAYSWHSSFPSTMWEPSTPTHMHCTVNFTQYTQSRCCSWGAQSPSFQLAAANSTALIPHIHC